MGGGPQAKVCFKFQATGTCRFGASCRFVHIADGSGAAFAGDGGRGRGRYDGVARVEATTTPFSLDAYRTQLAKQLTSSAIYADYSDALVSFSTGRDRLDGLWKEFLLPRDPSNPWRLDSQTQVLNFVNSGLRALSSDAFANAFVRELGKTDGRGILVMQELLDHEFAADAGRRRDVVSFQRGLVAFVTMLTMQRLGTASRHMEEANCVYAFVHTAHAQLFTKYLCELERIVERHDLDDCWLGLTEFLEDCEGHKFAPLCFAQICMPFIRLLYLLGSKFQGLIYERAFQDAVRQVDALLVMWTTHPRASQGLSLGSDQEGDLDSPLCAKIMKEQVGRLHKMIQRGDQSMQTAAALRKRALELARHHDGDARQAGSAGWDILEVEMPGAAVYPDGTIGPRHDNDHREIRDIQLLPTTQECLCEEPPVLPGNFPFHRNAHWLPPGPERWIDTHFRLFREDFCGTLRTSLQDLQYRLAETHGTLTGGRLKDATVDYTVFPVVDSKLLVLHTQNSEPREQRGDRRVQRHGLCHVVRFPHPSIAHVVGSRKASKNSGKDNTAARRAMWEKTGWLPYNGMVALVTYVNGTFEAVFCYITDRDETKLVKDIAEVTVQPFVTKDFKTLERWQRMYAVHRDDLRGSAPVMFLVEFNKVFLVAYEPVLQALQSLRPAAMPFLDYLAPDGPPEEGRVEMEVPLYCLKAGFQFDLTSAVAREGAAGLVQRERLHLRPLEPASRDDCEEALVQYSTLERDQAKAMVRALSSRVACIQGLPGSGKSFIGTLLTRVIVHASVSPVLVVCYTNHALDQFLCHLLDAGISNLVRVGGQSKEPRLEKYNLNKIPKSFPRYELKLLYEQLDECAAEILAASRELNAKSRSLSWKALKGFLETNDPNIFDYFEEWQGDLFSDGWEIAGCKDVLDYWLQGRDLGSGQLHVSSTQSPNVWQWNLADRHAAKDEWFNAMQAEHVEELVKAQAEYRDTLKKLAIVKDQADVDMLRKVQIIGMTTTGVAKHQGKIAAVAPPVVICEEAGEVLEAQLMACLTPSCQQLILIGDHKQLRPHIAEYNLSVESSVGKRFALDVSLFERLVSPASGLPWWMLTEQHRMRPQISQLLRMLFYPEVRDALETTDYPQLLGIDQNVYFVTHSNPEDNASGLPGSSARSHSNAYEVDYLVATLRYLLQQGYRTSDIAILTPYVSQLVKLRTALRGQFILELNELDLTEIKRALEDMDEDSGDAIDFEDATHGGSTMLGATKTSLAGSIRAATVDNFQGEEATVILVSLVRSSANPNRGTIGFLKTPNRINVLLSRAKHGLVLVGHGDLLRQKSPLWQRILDKLESDGCYGSGLPLHCQQHPDYHWVATQPESFGQLAPDGGCLRPCGQRLPRCGHTCPKLCHTDQPSHTAIYCTQPCPRLQDGCRHVCPEVCGDPCGPCRVEIGTIELACGHKYRNARCYEAKATTKLRCKELVDKVVPECGHARRIACSTSKFKCTRKCGAALPCGHGCSSSCSECVAKTLEAFENEPEPDLPIVPSEHGPCQKECGRVLPCSHPCHGICHGKMPCPPCKHICDVFRCIHGACNHPCSDPCAACTEPCDWQCEHRDRCPLPCGAPCNRQLCDQRCTKSLDCGHQCPSVCGEICPSREFCHQCGDDELKDRVADVVLFQTYGELDPSEDPVLVLPCCLTVYTMATLDGTLHMNDYFTTSGRPRGPLPSEYMDLPQCPNCKQPIRGLRRYGRVTKRAAIDAAEKKFIAHSQRRLVELQQRVNVAADDGELTEGKTLWHDIQLFGATVKRPPCQKAYEACVAQLTKTRGGHGGGDVYIDQNTLPIPNTVFPYIGYFNLLSAQVALIRGATGIATNAETHARKAVSEFTRASLSQQKYEADLILVQALILSADKKLESSPATDGERTSQQQAVERIGNEASNLLDELSLAPPSFQTLHGPNLRNFRSKLEHTLSRARGLPFYEGVSLEEMRSVKLAMQEEFSGSGHWYRCTNGHPYSIGECGMPMEQTRCPECGAAVGGSNHQAVSGTAYDAYMESL